MTDRNYYAQQLNSQKLFQVYDTALPRVRRYLEEEIAFVRGSLSGGERVLELGAGYGRIVKALAPHCASIVGIDISQESVALGREYLRDCPNARLETMDVHQMSFDRPFDLVLCLQNGLSAMRAGDEAVSRIISAAARGGRVMFSTYSAAFWDHRLAWFREQAAKGLMGPIDEQQTKNGVIVCQDGFRATTHTPRELERIGQASGYPYELREIDQSSLFLILYK